MTKSNMSKGFARFAKRTTKGAYDEARKAERVARGIPLDIGVKGKGVFRLECGEKQHKGSEDPDDTYPCPKAIITVQTPESAKGKELTDPLSLTWYIKDSEKAGSEWTAEDAWVSMLQDLEQLGVPRELTTGYEDFQEVLDWIDKEPRYVNYEVIQETDQAGNPVHYRGKPNKRIVAYAFIEESEKPAADDSDEVPEFGPDTKYCEFRGVKYAILSQEDDQVEVQNTQTGRKRTLDIDQVTMED